MILTSESSPQLQTVAHLKFYCALYLILTSYLGDKELKVHGLKCQLVYQIDKGVVCAN